MKPRIVLACLVCLLLPFHIDAQSSTADSTWKLVGSPHFAGGMVYYTSIAMSPTGDPYVGYMDFQHGQRATVKRLLNGNWVSVGPVGFSAGLIWYMQLIFGPQDGLPYVAYRDGAFSNKATVMKFDGTNWIPVGSPGFSAGSVDYPSLKFSPSGELYLAFMDGAHPFKVTVMRYTGNSWVLVGNAGFSNEDGWYTNLDFNPITQEPYVAFGNVAKATVMRYNGTNWVAVGNTGFTAGRCPFLSMAIDNNGVPYVGYKDFENDQRTTVMKFNGTNWVPVGQVGFSSGHSTWQNIHFGPNEELYVAFNDSAYEDKARVMRFDGSTWGDVGQPGFTQGYAGYTTLAFHPSGRPYLAFMDENWDASVMKLDTLCTVLPTIAGNQELCVNSGYYSYTTEPGMSNYQWNIDPSGTITWGEGTNTIQVVWSQPGNKWLEVSYTNSSGCLPTNPTHYNIVVKPLPNPANSISGPMVVCAGDTSVHFSTPPIPNAVTYVWTLPQGASIVSGLWTSSIQVDFATNALSGEISVYGNNLCGNGLPSPTQIVTVNPIPPQPTISFLEMVFISSAEHGNQWYRDGILLLNDTNQTCLATVPGVYWTQVTSLGCPSDTSNHLTFDPVGVQGYMQSKMLCYPNPAKDYINLTIQKEGFSEFEVYIFNSLGQQVKQISVTDAHVQVAINNLPSGLYLLKAKSRTSSFVQRFIKLDEP